MVLDAVVLELLFNAVQQPLQKSLMKLRIRRLLFDDHMLQVSMGSLLVNGGNVLHDLRVVGLELGFLRKKELLLVHLPKLRLTFSPFSGSRRMSHKV